MSCNNRRASMRFIAPLQPGAAASGARHESARRRSTRARPRYRGLAELDYPFHDWTATVTRCGRICFNHVKINLSQVFAGQNVGVRQVSDRIWLVSFMDYDLGYFDDETCRLEPIENPFGPKVLPMCSGINCHPCDRNGPMKIGRGERI